MSLYVIKIQVSNLAKQHEFVKLEQANQAARLQTLLAA